MMSLYKPLPHVPIDPFRGPTQEDTSFSSPGSSHKPFPVIDLGNDLELPSVDSNRPLSPSYSPCSAAPVTGDYGCFGARFRGVSLREAGDLGASVLDASFVPRARVATGLKHVGEYFADWDVPCALGAQSAEWNDSGCMEVKRIRQVRFSKHLF
jgi:hypothetical protein